MKFEFIKIEGQVADSLMKSLSIEKTEFCRRSVGIINLKGFSDEVERE